MIYPITVYTVIGLTTCCILTFEPLQGLSLLRWGPQFCQKVKWRDLVWTHFSYQFFSVGLLNRHVGGARVLSLFAPPPSRPHPRQNFLAPVCPYSIPKGEFYSCRPLASLIHNLMCSDSASVVDYQHKVQRNGTGLLSSFHTHSDHQFFSVVFFHSEM